MSSRKRIVICGGGAIGAAIAYFSSRRGARPIVIERHEVAGVASGKSGAFLALSRNGGRGAPPRHRRGPDMRPERSRAQRRARERGGGRKRRRRDRDGRLSGRGG